VVALVALGELVLVALVELVLHVGGRLDGPARQLLLQLLQVGTARVVFLQAGHRVQQVLPAHELVLQRDVVVDVLLQPLRGEVEPLGSEVDVGDTFAREQSALADVLGDCCAVLLVLSIEEGQLALH
jgi:hypothetical protein